jgi:hypothetical protein
MEKPMNNIAKKIGIVFAAVALITVGISNLHANEVQWPSGQTQVEYQRFLDIETGNGDS